MVAAFLVPLDIGCVESAQQSMSIVYFLAAQFLPSVACVGMIPVVAFEKLLNKEQLETYLTLTAMQSLGEGEEIVSCVTCSYFEVRLDQPGIFFCQAGCAPHCVSC